MLIANGVTNECYIGFISMTDNKNLLIINDNKLLCWGLEKVISDGNLHIRTVNNGSDAIYEIKSTTYHSVFLDVNLPDMSGLDLLKKIRKISPNTKVIVMAENNLNYYRQNAMEGGASHFITKPFDASEVEAVIRNILY